MAFIVAESTKMGGPSSNTSLMNSLPLKRSTRKKWENAATHLSRGQFIFDPVCVVSWSEICSAASCSLVKCCSFPLVLAGSPITLLSNYLLLWLCPPPLLHNILNQAVSRQDCSSVVFNSSPYTSPTHLSWFCSKKNLKCCFVRFNFRSDTDKHI